MSRNPPLKLDSSSTPIRVAVLSTDPIAQAGLEAALRGSGVDLSDEDRTAEVVLWDAGAEPELSGVADQSVPVLVLIAEPAHVDAALAAGARGVVLRDQIGPSLLAALTAVRSGLTVLDHDLAPKRRTAAVAELPEPLTRREQEVIDLMAGGLSNKLIAARLGISEHTAKFHVNSILAKLDADTRTEAVVTAVRHGVVML